MAYIIWIDPLGPMQSMYPYGLGYPWDNPHPGFTLAELPFHIFLSKIQPTVKMRIANPEPRREPIPGGRDNSGGPWQVE